MPEDNVEQDSVTYSRRTSISYRIETYSFQDPGNASPNRRLSDTKVPQAQLNDFELLKVLGTGAYGKVYLVRKMDTNALFAMKVLKRATVVITEKENEHHFKSERDVLSMLNHPFIVQLYFAFKTPERLFLILQYAEGGTVFKHLAKERMFNEPTAAFYIGQLLLALEHLHRLGIIYRDLKPENVLLDAQGNILLSDFGTSKVALQAKTICGTLEYMAPEVLTQSEMYGAAADYWSLGIMLYDFLTGSPPFTSQSRKSTMDAILTKNPKFPPFLSSRATKLIKELLCKIPKARLGSGLEGSSAIKKHAFFKTMNWDKLCAREITPPFQPIVLNVDDEGSEKGKELEELICESEFFVRDRRGSIVVDDASQKTPPDDRVFSGF